MYSKNRILLILVLAIGLFFCGCKEKLERPTTEKPIFGNEITDGITLADKTQYITINQAGVQVILYYSLTEKCFLGSIENTSKNDITDIAVKINVDTDNEFIQTDTMVLKENSIEKITIESPVYKFTTWEAEILFPDGYKLSKKDKEPSVTIASRMLNGVLINPSTNLMKAYEKYDVIRNRGVEINGKIHAGRHQSYTINKGGLSVTLAYDYAKNAVAGTISRNYSESVPTYYLKITYDNNETDLASNIGKLSPGETAQIGFRNKSWEEFEIYRVVLHFNTAYGGEQPPEEIVIKDVF